jgi:hypothetical protein
MAKDYFQDIVPPGDDSIVPKKPQPKRERANAEPPPKPPRAVPLKGRAEFARPAPPPPPPLRPAPVEIDPREEFEMPERSIRNIPPPIRPRPRAEADVRGIPPRPPRRSSRKLLWIVAILCLAALGALALFVFRPTSVTVIPRTQPVTFDESAQFTAYPVGTAAAGTLSYSVITTDLEDSEVVAAQGSQHAEDKASGEVTVYNNYSASPVRLIKTTRFQTADGLIFRAPEDIVVPGKSAAGPGHINATVVADQAGTQYNVGPAQFTLPGLKSNAAMYAGVSAKSTGAMSGGFVGDKPQTAPGARESAVADIRNRLESAAHTFADGSANATSTVFSGLMQISYSDAPDTQEPGGGIRVHQKAHVVVPIFPADHFAAAIAQTVAADADSSAVMLVPGKAYAAHLVSVSSTTIGSDALNFSLSGAALLVWKVDASALQQALAGRNEAAFQTIVTGFPGIQEAHARIEPFWKKTFPTKPEDIKIYVESPAPNH